jgi:hypothetical protein
LEFREYKLKDISALVCSPYTRSDILENGLITFASKAKDINVELASVYKWWKMGRLDRRDFDYGLYPPFPMAFHKHFPALAFRASTKKLYKRDQLDVLILDSDPFIVTAFQSILYKTKPRAIIYRVSDPLYLRTSDPDLIAKEHSLLKISDEVWCPNDAVSDEISNKYGEKVVSIRNPRKQVNREEIDDEHGWVDQKFKTLMPDYKRMGIYFGKIAIDYIFLEKIAQENSDCAFAIFGEYRNENMPKNVFFLGFQPLKRIYGFMRRSDFFFDFAYSPQGTVEKIGITAKVLAAAEFQLPYLTSTRRDELLEAGAINLNIGGGGCGINNLLNGNPILKIDLEKFREDEFISQCSSRIQKICSNIIR